MKHLRRVESLLASGQLEQAAMLLDQHFPADLPDDARPPRTDLLRGWLQLARDDERGVLTLFAAAERDPALLGEAAQQVEDWLADTGKAHDTMLLRHELTRMHSLHATARDERAEVSGTEEYRPPAEELAVAITRALARWRGDIRAAWLAERRCALAPRWRHLELLLELKPRQWHFLAGARDRLRHYCQRIEQAMPVCRGTIAVRAYPLAALPAHVRNMRKQARPLFPETDDARLRELNHSVKDLNQSLGKDENNGKNNGKGRAFIPLARHGRALLASTATVLLLFPAWIGWRMMDNHATHQRMANLEQRHAATLAQRYWRREEAAGLFSPAKTVHAFFAALQANDGHPHLPLFTAASHPPGKGLRLTSGEIRSLWNSWQNCGAFRIYVEDNRAVARWPMARRGCMPLLLRREQGRWRIAWDEIRASLTVDSSGHWRFAARAGRPPRVWSFAFDFPPPPPQALRHAAFGVGSSAGMRKKPLARVLDEPAPLAQARKHAKNPPGQGT